jgi:glycosyltransferase involved in cell wall biosynthesis
MLSEIQNSKVSIVGVCPRNEGVIGGVSIHIVRLARKLNEQYLLSSLYNTTFVQKKIVKLNKIFNANGIQRVYNPSGLDKMKLVRSLKHNSLTFLYWLLRYGIHDKAQVIHIHNEENHAFVFWILRCFFRKRLVFTIHDQMRLSQIIDNSKINYFFLYRLFHDRTIKWIAVNRQIKEQLVFLGTRPSNIKIIPGYIEDIENYLLPTKMEDFIKTHSPIISVYAFGTTRFDGNDLYGIDLSIQLIPQILNSYPDIGIVICIPGTKDKTIMNGYLDFIRQQNIDSHVYFQLDPLDSCTLLWRKSDIYLRPTTTDGDALAVREALECNTVVVASDVVDRPDTCVLFKNRDLNDLSVKVEKTLQNLIQIKQSISVHSDFFEDILKVYTEAVKG